MSHPPVGPPFGGPPVDLSADDADEWLAGLSVDELSELLGVSDDVDAGVAGLDVRPEPGGFAADGSIDAMPPGPVLAALAQDAYDGGLRGLPDDELVGVLCAARRLASRQAAIEFAAVSELDARRQRAAGRPGWSRVSEHVSAELAAALTLTGRSADALLGLSRGLARFPAVRAALFAGRIDRDRAAVFVTELAGLDDITAAAVAAAFVGLAGSMTTGQIRAALRAMVLAVDPASARRRAEKGRADARVEVWQEGSGNAALAGRELPPADVIAADKRISAVARALKDAGAPGTMDQLRAAVFAALLAGRDPGSLVPEVDTPASAASSPAGAVPSRVGLGVMAGSVNLTMPVSAWLGMSDAPGEVAAYGPQDAQTCRDLVDRLAAGPVTRWCVTLTGPDGRAAAHACARAGPPASTGPPASAGPPSRSGRPGPRPGVSRAAWLAALNFDWLERGACAHRRQADGYRPPDRLRELVKVRQRTCAFPGCRRSARMCDDDHTTPYDQGGRTCECNLAPLCRRHHRAKQAPGWRVDQSEPGILTWTLPHGRSYTAQADAYPV
jgi:hypothetical protein